MNQNNDKFVWLWKKEHAETIFRSPGSWNNEVSHAVTIRLFLAELMFKDIFKYNRQTIKIVAASTYSTTCT